MSYYSNLGLFWEVMAPVFFEMSDIYDEGGFKGVPDAMNFLVNGIFAIAGRPIYHHVYIRGECYEIIPKSKASCAVQSCHLMWKLFSTSPFRVQSLTMPRRSKSLTIKRLSLRNSLC